MGIVIKNGHPQSHSQWDVFAFQRNRVIHELVNNCDKKHSSNVTQSQCFISFVHYYRVAKSVYFLPNSATAEEKTNRQRANLWMFSCIMLRFCTNMPISTFVFFNRTLRPTWLLTWCAYVFSGVEQEIHHLCTIMKYDHREGQEFSQNVKQFNLCWCSLIKHSCATGCLFNLIWCLMFLMLKNENYSHPIPLLCVSMASPKTKEQRTTFLSLYNV